MFAFEKSVGAIVFRKENGRIKYLLLKYEDGYWNFPKGHSEVGESDEETLRREIIEETGLASVQIMPSFRKQTFYFYRARSEEKAKREQQGKATNIFKRVIFYLAETKNQEVRISSEHIGFAWLEFEAALEKLKYRSSRNLLKKAQAQLEKHFAKKESLV